jgi:ABC-type phosphate transport system substrate-binding protein
MVNVHLPPKARRFTSMTVKEYLPERRRCLSWAALCALGALVWAPVVRGADYEVVVNNKVNVTSLSKDEVKAIFLGDKTTWPDGTPVKIVVLQEGPVHKAFLREVLGKTPTQFDNYWTKLVFTGRAGAPKSFSSMQQVIEFVAREAGAIGYVAPGRADQSLKTLTVR